MVRSRLGQLIISQDNLMAEYIKYEKLQPGMTLFAKSSYHHLKFHQYLFIIAREGAELRGLLVTFTFRGNITEPSGLETTFNSNSKIGKGWYDDKGFYLAEPSNRFLRFLETTKSKKEVILRLFN